MDIKKFSYLIYPAVIAVSLAWAVSGWLSMKTSAGVSLPEHSSVVKRNKTEALPDTAEILRKNIFKTDTGSVSAGTSEKKAESHAFAPADSGFDGKLLGVVFGGGDSFAVVSYRDKKYILKKDHEKDGLTLTDVGYYHAVVSLMGKEYRLLLTPENGEQPSQLVSKAQADGAVSVQSDGVNRFKVKRSELLAKLADVNNVIKSVLIVPYEQNKEFVGYRIRRMTNTSVFRTIGVERNDVIMRLNGKVLDTPTVFFDTLKNAETMTSVTLDLLRNNKKMTIYVEIEG